MNQLQAFSFSGNEVRVVIQNGEPWWVAKDVCEVLSLSNPTMALQSLDQDERAKLNLGRQGETNIVNESGLYSLILGSRKPEAKQFKRWITREVIPAIRKTGSYSVSQSKILNDAKLEIQKQRAEAMLKNAQARQAKLIFDVTHRFRDRLPDVTVQSLIAAGTKTLTGQELLPPPKAEQKFHTCEEIAKRLGAMSEKGIPHNKAIAALIKHVGFAETEVVTVVESVGSWQGTTDKYADSVISRLEQKLDELGYPPVLQLDKSFKVVWQRTGEIQHV
ncbi:BRO-N domain-containing protein [Paenibacillus sp. USDA918EY]|uniref:BRO-N domain-containing protein n=1 Tax=Paenibacillus sp. USDA918EY TaxID=2689575 RepID=UPI00135C0A9E|nr:Bro-N domain-containing protein [Paenibacillus sp. USDA918EY]